MSCASALRIQDRSGCGGCWMDAGEGRDSHCMPTSAKMGRPGGRSWQEGLPGGGELAVWEDLDGEKVGQWPGSGKSGKRCPGRVEGKGSYDGSGEKHLPRSQWCKHSVSVCVCVYARVHRHTPPASLLPPPLSQPPRQSPGAQLRPLSPAPPNPRLPNHRPRPRQMHSPSSLSVPAPLLSQSLLPSPL